MLSGAALHARVAYPELPTLTVEALTERVCESLRSSTTSGPLAPGQRLVEARLAERLGVSRAPVREAIRVLEREGLVRSLPRRGVIVSVLNIDDVREIYGLRSAVESWAGREACRKSTPDDLDELDRIVRAMKESSDSGEAGRLSALDVEFHRTICEIAGNQRLIDVWLGMLGQIRLLSRQVATTLYTDLSQIPSRHQAVLVALQARDADAVEVCIREHIDSVAHRLAGAFALAPDAARSDLENGRT